MTINFLQTNQSAYDQVAGQYARRNGEMTPDLLSFASDFARLFSSSDRPLTPDVRILDIGCGAGRDLAWMQEHFPNCFGADLTMGMLTEARQVTHASLCQADMLQMPFFTACFGAVWCAAALLHIPHAEASIAVSEFARVLLPGGLLHISVQKGVGEGMERSSYDPPVMRFYSRYDTNEMDEMLVNAGFAIVESGDMQGHRHWLWYNARKL